MAQASTTDGDPRGGRLGDRRGELSRKLGLFTVLCIGVNNIIGSGIYQKPGVLAHQLGPASWLGFAVDALLLTTVALCFSTMSARHSETGGPYLYAKRALGRWAAFVVAWTAWISMWAAAAAVTTTLPGQLALFVPGLASPVPAIAIGLATLAFFCMVNCIGVKPAAGTATLLTVAKVVPLALLAVAGVWHLAHAPAADGGAAHASLLPDLAQPAFGRAFGSALFSAFYPLQGFEVVPVPAGELSNPRRDVPLAVTGALLLTAVLYCVIQYVSFGAAPLLGLRIETGPGGVDQIVGPLVGPSRDALLAAAGLAHQAPLEQMQAVATATERPLSAAAAAVLGRPGEMLLALGACVSFLGFASVTILCAPRFLVALADDGMLPRSFGVHHPKFGTPVVAVVVTCAAAAVGGLVAGAGGRAAEQFDRLTALSNVAVLVQYATTCLAVLLLPAAEVAGLLRRFFARRVLPLAGLGVCLFLGYLISLEPNPGAQVLGFAGWTVAGVALATYARRYCKH